MNSHLKLAMAGKNRSYGCEIGAKKGVSGISTPIIRDISLTNKGKISVWWNVERIVKVAGFGTAAAGGIKVDDLAIAQNEKAADSDRYRYAKRLSVRQRQSTYNEPQAGFSQYQEDDGVGQTRGHPDNIDV